MYLQSLIKRKQFWRYGADGWVLMELPTVRARSIWSKRLILMETRFWQSRLGLKVRIFCGNQQREFRLKWSRKIDELIEAKEITENLTIIG